MYVCMYVCMYNIMNVCIYVIIYIPAWGGTGNAFQFCGKGADLSQPAGWWATCQRNVEMSPQNILGKHSSLIPSRDVRRIQIRSGV